MEEIESPLGNLSSKGSSYNSLGVNLLCIFGTDEGIQSDKNSSCRKVLLVFFGNHSLFSFGF